MSQEKVDYKKEQKKNIKKTIRQRKASNIVITTLLVVFAVAVVGWLSYSGYKSYLTAKANAPRESIPIDVSDMTNYLNSLVAGDVEEADSETTVTNYDADGNVIEDTGVETETVEGDANVGSLEEAASVIAADAAENAAEETTEGAETEGAEAETQAE